MSKITHYLTIKLKDIDTGSPKEFGLNATEYKEIMEAIAEGSNSIVLRGNYILVSTIIGIIEE